jgi:type II secretory pathway pseudopilin PulG
MGKNELFMYVLFFAVFLLFNYFMQQAAKRARQRQEQAQAQQQAQQQEAAPSPDDESAEYLWGRRTVADLPATAAYVEPLPRVEAIATPASSPGLTAPRALFRSTQDLRHAIVVMTVLGPCRALEPYNEGHDK